jgi:putative ATP-dependent endonuclease of OLD family
MYVKELRLWNFRKYGRADISGSPSIIINFKRYLNVLIGENDSGKTAIIDAIRLVLGTKSFEQTRIDEKDFYFDKEKNVRERSFKIEVIFNDLSDEEAGQFLEWGNFDENNEYELKLQMVAENQNNRITYEIKAGPDDNGSQLDGKARELLKVTYLKPLRDAESELTPGYRSRIAQILLALKDFHKKKDDEGNETRHELERIFEEANNKISKYMNPKKIDGAPDKPVHLINYYLQQFLDEYDERKAEFKASPVELIRILKRLELNIEENLSGLGTLNKLFMAAELLSLESETRPSNKMALIEELEAHLHPQAQLRVIKALEEESQEKGIQLILTTHSTTLGSSVPLDNLIICKNKDVFPMWKGKTELSDGDYNFLQRFLDATKANLFFAKGVIIVEGDAENILIPTIAEIIGKPLHKYGVSIVNVGSTAFLRYAKIFMRKDEQDMSIPVSVITDMDVRPKEYYEHIEKKIPLEKELDEKRTRKKGKYENKGNVSYFINDIWTMEYDFALSKNLRLLIYRSILAASEVKNDDTYDLNNLENRNKIRESGEIYFKENSSLSDEKLAFEVYKPLLTKLCSKAVTAQYFSMLLEKENKSFVENIKQDKYIRYIIDAINYVTPEKKNDNADN